MAERKKINPRANAKFSEGLDSLICEELIFEGILWDKLDLNGYTYRAVARKGGGETLS